MRRDHFDAIIDDIKRRNDGEDFELRVSMRNSEVYFGTLGALPGADDVLTLSEQESVVYIALPAIATVSQAMP